MKNHQLAPGSTIILKKESTSSLKGYYLPGISGRRFCQALSTAAGIKICHTVLIWLMMFTMLSCKKDVIATAGTDSPPPPSDRDIYVAGYNNGKIVYWKNGVEHVLCTSDWITGEALGIAVSGKDVYVVGKRNNNAVYWKNGVELALTTDTAGIEEATSIAIDGEDIYITGNEAHGNNGSRAVYWKNGVKTILAYDTDDFKRAGARRITISGNDVYISGFVRDTAVFWKNGLRTTLKAGFSTAHGIAVSGADIYVSGAEHGSPVYWKNGSQTSLCSGSGDAYDICISGEDVYVTGVYDGQAFLWKNDTRTVMGTDYSAGTAITNMGGDIYVAGSVVTTAGTTPAYWKNGSNTNLSFLPASSAGVATASAIAVVKH